MPASAPAASLLANEFLALRCRLIEVAAILDRMERGGGVAADDPRWLPIRRSLELLAGPLPNRAAEVQMAFSLPDAEKAVDG